MTLTTEYQLVGSVATEVSYGATYYQGIYAKYSRTSQQQLNNKSTIYIKVCAWNDKNSSEYSTTGNWVGTLNGLFTNSYTTWAKIQGGVSEANRTILWAASVEVTHNNDGTYSTSIGATNVDSPFGTPSTIPSTTLTLPSIPRAATLTVVTDNVYVGNYMAFDISPYVSSFTYTLVGSNSNGTITFFTKQSIDHYLTNSLTDNNFYTFFGASDTYADVTYTLTTYSGNTVIGTDTKTARINANPNHKPTVTVASVDTGKAVNGTNLTTLDLTGSNKRIINQWNTISSTWTATTDIRYNTTIASTSINGNAVTTSPTTLNDISNGITVVATDARGTSKSVVEDDLTFIPYEYPSIVPTIKRNTATDGHVNLTFTGMFYNTDFGVETNDLTLTWYVREKGTQNYTQGATSLTYTINSDNISYVNSATISLVNPLDQVDGLFDYAKAYEFKFVATDLVTSYTISEVVLTKGIPNFVVFKDNILANGEIVPTVVNSYSASISKTYSANYINGLISSGSNNNGDYVKFSDGTMICYKKVTGTTNIASSWGSLYQSSSINLGSWAETFASSPVVSVYPQSQYGTQFMLSSNDSADTTSTTNAGSVILVRPNSRNDVAYVLYVIGIGKWQ